MTQKRKLTTEKITLGKKIARMGMGYDKYHVQHDPNIPCGEAELLAKEEATKNNSTKHTARILHEVDKKTSHARIVDMFAESEAHIDNLAGFHKDAMEFLRSLDVYSNSDRLKQVKQLQALMKLGAEIEVYD